MGDALLLHEPLSRHTTLKIGGPADAWAAPSSLETLARLVSFCLQEELSITVFGGGSNVLVGDGGIRGVVVSTRSLRDIERMDETQVRAGAGVSTGKLLHLATKWQLGGVEFLAGVPGSVGGGLIMNAGTYMGEFKDVTERVTSLSLTDGSLVSRDNAECGFVYRGSALPSTEVVCEGIFRLAPRDVDGIEADIASLKARRREREPKGASNAGSVFKNPPGDFAGRLLESVGFKGTRCGAAECSPVHANWFVNHGGARAKDMLELIEKARQAVRDAHGIELVLEWKLIGENEE